MVDKTTALIQKQPYIGITINRFKCLTVQYWLKVLYSDFGGCYELCTISRHI